MNGPPGALHVAIPFDMATIRQSWGQAIRMWGRVVATHDFVTALARSRECTRLTVLVPGRSDVGLFRDTILAGVGTAGCEVQVVAYPDIPSLMAGSPPDVLHVLDPNLWLAGHIRGQFAVTKPPITGVTHSLANQHFMEWALLNDANGIDQDDCLVCSTPTAKAVVDAWFDRLKDCRPGFNAPATVVIPLGIDLPVGADAAGPRQGSDRNEFVVLSFARFNPDFKMDLLPVLAVVARLRERMTRPLRLVLAGSSGGGVYQDFVLARAAEAGVADLVQVCPDPDETARRGLLASADVFLSLSDNIQETFGLTVVEAMAAGLPAVVSDWDGYRSLVEDGVVGYRIPTLVPPVEETWDAVLALRPDSLMHSFSAQLTAVDIEAAAGRLFELSADEGRRRAMGDRARAEARQYAWPRIVSRYGELWRRMAARPPNGGALPGPRSSAIRVGRDFGVYATRRLSGTDTFRTTAAGSAVLAGRMSLHFYRESTDFLDEKLLASILDQCRQPTALADIRETGNSAPGGPGHVGRNLIWLYKRGYLAMVEGGA